MGKVVEEVADGMDTAVNAADAEAAASGIPLGPQDEVKPKRRRRTREQMIADGDMPKSYAGSSTKGAAAEKALATKIHDDILMPLSVGFGMLNPLDGAIIAGNAERLSKAYAKLAMQNPRLRRFFETGIEGSAILGVVLATGFTVLPILANHNMIPEKLANKIPVPQSVIAEFMAAQATMQPEPATANGSASDS